MSNGVFVPGVFRVRARLVNVKNTLRLTGQEQGVGGGGVVMRET